MQPLTHTLSLLLSLLSFLTLTTAQGVAAGGGAAATTLAPTQYPTINIGNSLFTVNGVTSASLGAFTQTFAATALGSWDLGPTPGVGSIGLGAIQGTVGVIKSKRAMPTDGW